MRGTRHLRVRGESRVGIIPAHAGNTVGLCHRGLSRRDHPRACGEHELRLFRIHRLEGSSPRMRGTLQLNIKLAGSCGIIPAHAGNTLGRRASFVSKGDHPRACGEHFVVVLHGFLSLWIIPAHAGNTVWMKLVPDFRRDHPRACGEHSFSLPSVNRISGSSPRMRGTLCRKPELVD